MLYIREQMIRPYLLETVFQVSIECRVPLLYFATCLQIPRIQSEGKNGITVIIGIYDRDISYAVSSFFVGKSFPCKITFYGFSFFVFLYVHI